MILTPDSGPSSRMSSPGQVDQGRGQGQVEQAQGGAKRRPTAFYPNIKSTTRTLKPFSRSAAKRESVLALGSIEHLQHYFTKTGLAAKRDPLDKPHYGLVPAIGPAAYPTASTSTSASASASASTSTSTPSNAVENSSPDASALPSTPDLILPPSPELPLPRRPSYLPNLNQPKTYETDPESLLPGVVDDLNAVARAWEIHKDDDTVIGNDGEPIVTVSAYETNKRNAGIGLGGGGLDVLDLLKTTTRAIRSTRNYLVSLPDESTLSTVTARAHFRPTVLSPPGKSQSRASHSSSPASKARGREKDKDGDKQRDVDGRESSHERGVDTNKGREEEDPTILVRKSALEVLSALREVEERYRLPLSDEAYDVQSDGGTAHHHHYHHHHGARTRSPTSDSEPGDFHLDTRHHTHLTSHAQSMHEGDLSVTYSLMPIQVGDRLEHVPVWEDEESESDWEEETEKRELWDERLVLGSGWLYRQDVKVEEMESERKVVSRYLDVVDRVIFGRRGEHVSHRHGAREEDDEEWSEGRKERAWERERRRILTKNLRSRSKGRRASGIVVDASEGETHSIAMVLEQERRVSTSGVDAGKAAEEPEEMAPSLMGVRSISMGNIAGGILEGREEEYGGLEEGEESESEGVDDDDLPEWAKRRTTFTGDDLGRAHAFISAFLPSHLVRLLGPFDSRTEFLQNLSSGQLLCAAYNTCVRKSKKPWGYVSKDSIHDIVALERAQAEAEGGLAGEGRRKGWTFRRTDNLRLWVGALKLRYLLPIQTPSQPLTQSSLNSLKLLGELQSSLSTGTTTSLQAHLNSLSHANNHFVAPPSLFAGASPTKTRFASLDEPPIEFDARLVARKDGEWEDMLEKVLVRWMWKAVGEKRSLH